jgi:RNA polymerase sigma-70 factor (ECF subfamily)
MTGGSSSGSSSADSTDQQADRRPTDEDPPDDHTLLRRHVEGDGDAFGELVRRHRNRLWAVALRTTADPEEAADALQDALLSAFRRAEGFRGDSAVTTWLHRIVVNACLDRARRNKVRASEPLPEAAEPVAPGRHPSVEEHVEQVDQRQAVLAALRTLPADQRAAVVLVDMEGYSVDEAAGMLECAPGTIKSRCSRGRARLLPLLADWRTTSPRSVEPTGEPARHTEAARSRTASGPPGTAPGQEQEVT